MTDSPAAVKSAFRVLASTIDEVGEERTPLFLAKLALLLANHIGDSDAFDEAVRRAARSFKEGSQ